MPAVHSKDSKKTDPNAILMSFFFGVANYVLLLPAELQMTQQILKGDLAQTSRMLAITGGVSGLLEFCLNPTFGKLSDRIGRRPFFLVGPAYVFLGNAVLAVFAKNLSPSMLPLILVNSLLRKVAATVSGSVASVTALSDVSSGRAFAINISKLWAYAGAGVVCAPFISGYLENAFGPRGVYVAASLGGLIQLIHNYLCISETKKLTEKNNQDNSILVNPLHCFKLFTSSSIVRTTALACMFASFVEGKNMSAVNSMYLRNQLGLDALRASRYVVLYGIAMYTSGQYWGPILMKRFGPRTFTTLANVLNLLGFVIHANSKSLQGVVFALCLLFTGINANSASAMKALAGDAAIKAGYGRGLFNGHFSNLRAIITSWAPMLYGGLYSYAIRKGQNPAAYVYGAAILFGCVVPELCHRSLSSDDMLWTRKKKSAATAPSNKKKGA